MNTTKTFDAKMDRLDDVLSFIRNSALKRDIEEDNISKVILASEEAIVNVLKYAYPDDPGELTVKCEKLEEQQGFSITLIDSGVEFDPTEVEEPDVDIPIEDRDVGGLGIFMINNIMDEMEYKRENGQNILTLKKFNLKE